MMFHGITTSMSSINKSESTFEEFKTDDLSILEEEVKKLDMELGHSYIKVIKEVDYDVLVDVAEDNENEDPSLSEETEDTENSKSTK